MKLCTALIALIIFFSSFAHAFAVTPVGFGDFNDYDTGGDYGGDYGGGYDGGYGGGDYGGYDSDYEGDGFFSPIFILIVLVVIGGNVVKAVVVGKRKKGGGYTRLDSHYLPDTVVPDRTSQIEGLIREYDKNFSSGDFIAFAKNVYIDIQNAWCARDLSTVRPVLHQNLYAQTQKQIEAKIQQGIINKLENISVGEAYLTAYKRDTQYEYLTVYLTAKMIDYQYKEDTGEIVFGDRTTRWSMKYKMKFMRSAGMVTGDGCDVREHKCPNCGADLLLSSVGECEYCGAVLTSENHTWVLIDFCGIKNETTDEGIHVE